MEIFTYAVLFLIGIFFGSFFTLAVYRIPRGENILYKHSYCIESANVQAIPVYYLEPNTRVYIRDDKSKINGEYIVSKITIPLTFNGMMSLTATKAVESII